MTEYQFQPEYAILSDNLRTIVETLDLTKKAILTGPEKAGKSSIASAIFKLIQSENKRPLYIDFCKLKEAADFDDELPARIVRKIEKYDYIIFENLSYGFMGLALEPIYAILMNKIEDFILTTSKPLLITNRGTLENLLLNIPFLAEIENPNVVNLKLVLK